MSESTFAERLSLALEGGSVYAFAQKSGIGESTLRKYLSGSMPGLDNLLAIAEAAEVTLDWLAAERGPMRPGPSQTMVMPPMQDRAGAVSVPRFEVRASAGHGALALAEDAAEYFSVGRDWLRRNLPAWAPLNAEIGVLDGSGDSMEPTIRDGDTLMIVRGVEWRTVERGGVFVLSLDDRLLLKRLQVMDNGDLRIISDNKAYDPFSVRHLDIPERVRIEGMVFFVGGRPRNY